MVCFGGPSLLTRKGKDETMQTERFDIRHPSRPVNMEERALRTHARLYSITSNSSNSSSESDFSSRAPSYNPLQSHPPLQMNASPIVEAKFLEEADEEHDKHMSIDELSLLDEDFDDSRSSRRMTYVYNQAVQWPLKDWQTVPPGLVPTQNGTEFVATPLRPTPATHQQRRPTEWKDESDSFVKRGSWKRRGIIFQSDGSSHDGNHQHFELPEY